MTGTSDTPRRAHPQCGLPSPAAQRRHGKLREVKQQHGDAGTKLPGQDARLCGPAHHLHHRSDAGSRVHDRCLPPWKQAQVVLDLGSGSVQAQWCSYVGPCRSLVAKREPQAPDSMGSGMRWSSTHTKSAGQKGCSPPNPVSHW